MTIPPYLRTNDAVAIVAPAGLLEPKQIALAIKIIESWGLTIHSGKNLFSKHYNFSGTDTERTADLQEVLDNHKIKAIFCARGGYGTLRILDKIDWSGFINNPKWIIGYSDITALHSVVNNTLQIASVHGPMPVNFEKLQDEQKSLYYLKKILFGETLTYSIPNENQTIPSEIEGNIIGGNLSLLYSLRGTPYDFKSENNIIFIEDIGEYFYHIDRMIHNFKLGNKFSGLKAIILGGFTDIKDNDIPFGLTIEEIVTKALNGKVIPVIKNFPAGHTIPNYPLIFGSGIKIKIEKEKIGFFLNQ
jgi:muramoyltetrapeptide carboxypeptidase